MTTNEYLDPNSDIIKKIVSQYPNGLSANGLVRLITIESSGNPNAVSPGGGYEGLCQIGEAEFQEYGPKGGARLNPEDNLMAGANLAQCDARQLAHILGKKPTDAQIYLAHQQGVTGALKLLENPNTRAGDLVGDSHIKENLGNPNAAAHIFTDMWAHIFNVGRSVNG
jgi:hypothetical protein